MHQIQSLKIEIWPQPDRAEFIVTSVDIVVWQRGPTADSSKQETIQKQLQTQLYVHCVSKKTSRMFLAITRESIVGFS